MFHQLHSVSNTEQYKKQFYNQFTKGKALKLAQHITMNQHLHSSGERNGMQIGNYINTCITVAAVGKNIPFRMKQS